MVQRSKSLIARVHGVDGELQTDREEVAMEFLEYFKAWVGNAAIVGAHELV